MAGVSEGREKRNDHSTSISRAAFGYCSESCRERHDIRKVTQT